MCNERKKWRSTHNQGDDKKKEKPIHTVRGPEAANKHQQGTNAEKDTDEQRSKPSEISRTKSEDLYKQAENYVLAEVNPRHTNKLDDNMKVAWTRKVKFPGRFAPQNDDL